MYLPLFCPKFSSPSIIAYEISLYFGTEQEFINFTEKNQIFFRKSPTSQATPITPPAHTRSNAWFPLNFSMEIDDRGDLNIHSNINGTISPPPSKLPTDEEISELINEMKKMEKSTQPEEAEKSTESQQFVSSSKKKEYELSAVVCDINDGSQRNFVALIYISNSYHKLKLGSDWAKPGQWYLFNDFSISPVSYQEAVWFTLDWKIPCVLYYSSTEFTKADDEVALNQFMNPFVHVNNIVFLQSISI